MFAYYSAYYLDMVGTVALLGGVFFVLELLAPAEKGQSLSKRVFNLVYYPLYLAAVLLLSFCFNPAFTRLLKITGGGLLPRLIAPPQGFVRQVLFALLFAFVWDLWQYWLHRLQHASPLLWQTPKFHHHETALNSSVHARHHLTSTFLFLICQAPLLVIFGGLSPHLIASFVMSRIWGFINHANLRVHFGPLTPVLAGPQWHRIHHSTMAEHRDKNFAAFFPFIDILFGTYCRPRREEFPATGLAEEQSIGSFPQATLEPLVGIYRIAKNQPRVGEGWRRLTGRATVTDQV